MTIEGYWSIEFSKRLQNAFLVLSDGMPLVKAIQFLYSERQDRIAGMDVMPDLLKMAEINNLGVFFFGSTDSELKLISKKISTEFPRLKISGVLSPPFMKDLSDSNYCKIINDSGANIVFVALGCPKQENWMALNSPLINSVLLGVGGAFPVYAGLVRRAPLWMQKYSLEWAFRLIQEPKRMWKRYLSTNSIFVYLILKDFIKGIFKHQK
ncbi:MAG: WecB/TagA/CpsF family glycosyltransferase [Flammeovirgaceae bacterium]|nr:WecB/TagA/CpsF family glycosyltransferase [Flammeovirgaceae bacterium]